MDWHVRTKRRDEKCRKGKHKRKGTCGGCRLKCRNTVRMRLKEIWFEGAVGIDLIPIESFYEYYSEPSGFIKVGSFFDQMNYCHLIMNSALPNLLVQAETRCVDMEGYEAV
jgi:hypothetical protein